MGVMSDHNARAFGAEAARAFLKSDGTAGSGSSAAGAMSSVTTSPASAPAASLSFPVGHFSKSLGQIQNLDPDHLMSGLKSKTTPVDTLPARPYSYRRLDPKDGCRWCDDHRFAQVLTAQQAISVFRQAKTGGQFGHVTRELSDLDFTC